MNSKNQLQENFQYTEYTEKLHNLLLSGYLIIFNDAKQCNIIINDNDNVLEYFVYSNYNNLPKLKYIISEKEDDKIVKKQTLIIFKKYIDYNRFYRYFVEGYIIPSYYNTKETKEVHDIIRYHDDEDKENNKK